MRPRRPLTGSPSRADRWALWAGLTDTAREFRLHWIAIPVSAKTRFFATLAAGFVACAVLTAALTLVAKWWAPRGLAAWDERALRALDAQAAFSVQNAILLESFGNLAYMIPLIATCAVVAARWRRPLLAVAFPAAYLLARGLVWVGWLLWDRDRPRFILGGQAAPPLHSYPSGHVVLALSGYGLLAYLWARASDSWIERALAVALGLALVAATAVARVRLGTHWFSDVIAGSVIGLAWLAVVLLALRASENHN